jgi:outer membrane immunogenic protein
MIKTLLASAALLGLTGAAFAADLPTRKAAPEYTPPPPLFTWTGFYIGGYAGGGFGTAHWTDLPFPGFTNGSHIDPSGFVGGGLIGYNFQMGPLVFGIEGEGGYNGISATRDYATAGGATRHEKFGGSDVERVRGRVGYAFNNFLLFFAGGGSFADGRLSFLNPANSFANAGNKTYSGFNIGGGGEYAFDSHWIGRIEYLYDDFGHATYSFPSGGFDARRVSFSENTIRAAIEYKF